MRRDRKGYADVSGELLHGLLGLPDAVEVLDFRIQLRGPGLPDDCVLVECALPTLVDLSELTKG